MFFLGLVYCFVCVKNPTLGPCEIFLKLLHFPQTIYHCLCKGVSVILLLYLFCLLCVKLPHKFAYRFEFNVIAAKAVGISSFLYE